MKNIHYICIQILHCILICALSGYATVFLLDKGFSNTIVGTTMSLANIVGILGQQYLAGLIDKSQGKLSARLVTTLIFVGLGVCSLPLVFLTEASTFLLVNFVLVMTFLLLLTPFINALIFDFEKLGIEINYGLGRGMGSASYAVASLLFGQFTAAYGTAYLPYFYIVLAILAAMTVYTFKASGAIEVEKEEVKEDIPSSSGNFFTKYPLLTGTFVGIILIFFGFNITNSFLVQVVRHVGGDQSHLGIAMFLAAIVELPSMALYPKLSQKIGSYRLVMIAAVSFSIKIIVTWLSSSIYMIYAAQLLQFSSYAFFIPASVFLARDHVEESDRMKGQSLMTASVSVGGVFASAIGGVCLDVLGVSTTLAIASGVTVLGSLMMIYYMKRLSATR